MTRTRILLVDDEPTHVRLFLNMLEEMDAFIAVAKDGLEALDALDASAYDLVLMDVRLPRLDGVQATRRIRSSKAAYRDVPIIGITAFSLPHETAPFLEAGMNAAFTKPVDQEALMDMVNRFLGQS